MDIKYSNVDTQLKVYTGIISKNPIFLDILIKSKILDIGKVYITGGSLAQTIWNYYHNYKLDHSIKDIDVFYYNKDISKETEEAIQKKFCDLIPNSSLAIETINQARVHLWFKSDYGKTIKQYKSIKESINNIGTTATAIGITLDNKNKLEVYAPYGLSDVLSLVVRQNTILFTYEQFRSKATRWKKEWNQLKIINL